EKPLSKQISMIFSLLMANARKHDYAKDIRTARTVNQWVLDNVDRVLTDYANDKRVKRAKQLVALSGMSINAELDDPIDVNLMIPIFKAEFESDISSKLANINMAKVFNGTQFYLESNMKIDEFMQKTMVEIRPRNILNKVNDIDMQNITTFELNRPFVFVIKDKDYIYAVGRIDDLEGLASTGNCLKKYSDLD
ncbi:hypothetical protein M5D96_005487, partial [Drosophila gunungcola]